MQVEDQVLLLHGLEDGEEGRQIRHARGGVGGNTLWVDLDARDSRGCCFGDDIRGDGGVNLRCQLT